MFEGLFKPKFDSKCKSHARLIKTRLEVIRKKRNAVQKFLKKDIADLLKSGLDYNAYGRAEGLLVEKNMSSCYEFIPKFIECISVHARDLCKKRECPDECKEAISSLIYAAARFPDLPELRDLRTLFTEKFGNSLEPYTCKEFVNKLRQDPPSKEMKIRLLRDLAQEFSIKWDSKVLEQRIYSTPQLHEEKPKHDYKIDMAKRNERDKKNASDDKTKGCSSSLGSVSEDEVENKRPFSYGLVPPPSNDEPVIQEKKEKPRSVRTRGSREKAVDVVLMHYSKNESELSTTTPMRVHERATSLVPEMLSSTAKHVHPSLPDYEDFTARLAYLHSRT